MPGTIQRLEIFGAGTWKPANGGTVTITETALDEMVASFSELSGTNVVKPHLKLGHTEAQKWFGQKVGIPTLGWLSKVWREGNKLFADITDVPEALLDMIKAKRYHNVSAEIFYPGMIEHDGKKFGHVLSAVAILGTEMPAVKDLAGLAAALYATQFTANSTAQPTTFSQENSKPMFTQEQVDSLIAVATAKAIAETKTSFSDQITALTAETTTLKARAEGAEQLLASQAADFAQKEAAALVDAAIKDGKLLPKQKDAALAFMSVTGVVKFGGADKTATQVFSEFLGLMGKQVDTTEQGSGRGDTQDTGTFATAAAEVDSLTRAHMKKNATADYATAMGAVLQADRDLATRYAMGA
jgi:hypothetical protein